MLFERSQSKLLPIRRIERISRERAEQEIRARTQYAYLGDGLGLCRVLGRFNMYVDPRDVGHSAHLIVDGCWEIWITRFLIRRLRRGMVAVDVGANLGYFSMLMAEMVGRDGRVHAFEPNLAIADRLERSILLNGFKDRVTLHKAAVGADAADAVKLIVPDMMPSGAWLVAESAPVEGQTVPVRRLDAIPELAKADVVKIDAEGFEYQAWQGMAGILAAGRPMLILLEYAGGRAGHGIAFIDEIVAAGFTVSLINYESDARPISREEIAALPPERDVMLAIERR